MGKNNNWLLTTKRTKYAGCIKRVKRPNGSTILFSLDFSGIHSLAGRFFQYRPHPLDLKEVRSAYSAEEAFQRLWDCGGFPEPFLDGSPEFYQRWKKSHVDAILRQDLIDLQSIRDIQAIETLIELLKLSVGSAVSYAAFFAHQRWQRGGFSCSH